MLADSLRRFAADSEDLQLAGAAGRLELRPCPPRARRAAPCPPASRSRACPRPGPPPARRPACRSSSCRGSASSTSTRLPKPTTSVCVSTSRTSAASSCSRMRRIFVSRCAWSFLASWYSEFSLRSPHSRAVLMRSAISAPRDGLELLELGLQRLQALGGHDNRVAQARQSSPQERNSDATRRGRRPSSARRRPARGA